MASIAGHLTGHLEWVSGPTRPNLRRCTPICVPSRERQTGHINPSPFGRINGGHIGVGLRTCKVACRDIEGVAVEVAAESRYEAVARGLAAFRDATTTRPARSGTLIRLIIVVVK